MSDPGGPEVKQDRQATIWFTVVGLVVVASIVGVLVAVLNHKDGSTGDGSPTTSEGASSGDDSPAVDPTDDGSDLPYVFDGHGANVKASMFGKAWPLTIRSGRVNCIPLEAGGYKLTMVVFTADDGTRYAVNGTARSPSRMAENGFKDVTQIWADSKTAGLKKDISPIIDVCKPVMDR